MKTYMVEFSESAQTDLVATYEYIKQSLSAPDSARRVVRHLRDMILGLGTMPERYPLSRNEKLAHENVRLMPVGSFHVFYFVDNEKVIVARIMYGRRRVTPQDISIMTNDTIVCEPGRKYNR